jgi:succinyl-CoA synthetase alpha subunit
VTTETRFRVFADLYKDSVALMQLGAMLRKRPGIQEASCVMATPANLEQLQHANLSVVVDVDPSDLLVVVRGEAHACDEAIEAAQATLQGSHTAEQAEPLAFSVPVTSIAMGVERCGDADLALISVPGDYAAAEALKALSLGLHVMLFSDNVSIDEERAIKNYAGSKGLLVMGPDCGTAIINGTPLGFANVVRRGDIGLVAASGTGLQEVTCRIHNLGGGVSQAIGTGGRDLRDEIGGLTMLQGLRALADDSQTRVIVLISKPPSPAIAAGIVEVAVASGKPTVVHFLGGTPGAQGRASLYAAESLADAADIAVRLAKRGTPPAAPGAGSRPIDGRLDSLAPTQRAVNGLFTGGTFCYEAQLEFLRRGLPCRSNAPVHGALPLDGQGKAHTFIDMGDDEYTRGRPHPMIDPSLRNAAVRAAAADPTVAAILFDVVLGYGAHPDPTQELAEALLEAQQTAAALRRTLLMFGHVCGTDDDPQNKAAQVQRLADAGVIVADSNIRAARLAADVALHRAQR